MFIRDLIRVAFLGLGCLAAAVLITAIAYFAFDAPVVMLLPGAVVAKALWHQPAPPDVMVARMLAVNVVVLAATLAVVVIGVLSMRRRR
jgi:hypothetical protein